jgi:hypothetical protein
MAIVDSNGNTTSSDDSVKPVPVESPQTRVKPRQVTTGTTRGEQQIKGKLLVVDENNLPRVLIGYKENGF